MSLTQFNTLNLKQPISATPTLSERRNARMPSISTINSSSALNQQNTAQQQQQLGSTQQPGSFGQLEIQSKLLRVEFCRHFQYSKTLIISELFFGFS